MYGAGYSQPEWRRGRNACWRKSRPWDELDKRTTQAEDDKGVLRGLLKTKRATKDQSLVAVPLERQAARGPRDTQTINPGQAGE